MITWSRTAVLQLYRNLLQTSNKIKYSDKDYYRYLIQKEFRSNKGLKDPQGKQFQLEKGNYLLEQARGKVI